MKVLQLYYKVSYHNVPEEVKEREKRTRRIKEQRNKETERNEISDDLPPEATAAENNVMTDEHQPVLL